MATMNPFDVLNDDAEDPSQLIAAELEGIVASTPKKAGAQDQGKLVDHTLSQQKRKVAKMPTKPQPPVQALREARNVANQGGRVGGFGYAGCFNRGFPYDENSVGPAKPAQRGGPPPYRGGRRVVFSWRPHRVTKEAVAAAHKNSAVQKEAEEKEEMTLEEYEKVLEVKRKGLQALKTEERKVDIQEFQSMQKLSRKKGNDDFCKQKKVAKTPTKPQPPAQNKFAEGAPESSSEQRRRKGKTKVGVDLEESSDDSDCTSELYFSVLVTDSMVGAEELSLPAATCRKYMWRRIPPRPWWEAVSAGNERMGRWIFSSREENFDRKITIHFQGWRNFVEDNGLKEKDVVTFKKCWKGEVMFYAHVNRWVNRIHDYERVRFCPVCNEDI